MLSQLALLPFPQIIAQTVAETSKEVLRTAAVKVDLAQIFFASPIIYTILFSMSVLAVGIWFYSLYTFRAREIIPTAFIAEIRGLLTDKKYEKAVELCHLQNHFFADVISSGINSRKHGAKVMIDAMKSQGKRSAASFWQRLSLLNDIAVIAPMFGLLGTVVGMFYAFYDVSRSIESINALFDGLGIAVGTTVMGLIVAIMSMAFYTTLKYRLVKALSNVEHEALSLSHLIEPAGKS